MMKGILIALVFGLSGMISRACPTVSMSATDVSCYGGFDGQAQIVVTGSNGPFNITWTIGTLSGSFNNVAAGTVTNQGALPAGIFQVYVVDQLGCTSIQVITIYQPSPVTGTVSVTDVDCFGDLTGDIDLTVFGGTAPYTYNWSNSVVSQDNLNVAAGNYSVVITDAKNCVSSSIPATVNQPAEPVQTTYAFTNVSCAFGSDATIDLSAWGGTAPYTYSWNGGAYVTEDISGLTSGNYTVVVTDYKGCTHVDNAVITEPSQLTSTISATNVLCNGNSDGSINLTPIGGTAPYNFTWANSSFTLGNVEDLANIPAESYTVTITDAKGCTASNAITVTQPLPLDLTINSTNVSCYAGTDGTIDLIVAGGTPLYQYDWTNSTGASAGIAEDLINIPSETYTVVVTDNNGCQSTKSVEISQPLTPITLTYSVTNVACFGDNSGAVDLTVSGGTPGYIYSWSNTSSAQDISNLLANTYSVVVEDAMGCQKNVSVVVSQPAAPIGYSENITDVKCFGDATGVVDLTVSGGTGPYDFSWINSDYSLSESTEDLINFPADVYTLTITDANNCTLIEDFVIDEPAKLEGTFIVTDVSCHGDSTGAIDLEPQGGVAPYSYVWSNNEITEDINHVPAGWYSVEVTDLHNCVFIDSVEINEPLLPLSGYYSTTEPLCPGSADGSIQYTANGGTYPYNFLWSNFQSNQNIYNLTAGKYYMTVTDAKGCVLLDSAVLDEPDPINVTANITHALCYGLENGILDLTVTGGSVPYTYQWANSQYVLSVTYPDLYNYGAEKYTVIVTDDHGCTHEETYEIKQPDSLVVTPFISNISCADSTDGGILLSVAGGTPFYQYNWNTTDITQGIDNLPPGTYIYEVTDLKGCYATDTIELTEPELINFRAGVSPVSCWDLIDGEIQLNPQGGYGQYQYFWSNGTTANPATDLSGGNYTVTIVDLVGCARDTAIYVPALDVPCLTIPNAITPNGDGINDDWVIDNIDLYPDAVVRVFNKWGNAVFEITGYYTRWDGTFNGNDLPAATYYYIIDIGDGVRPFTGPITIVR